MFYAFSQALNRVRDVLSRVAEMAWDVLSGATKMAWGVLSGVTKTVWDVLSGVVNRCGMFCLGVKKWHGMFCPGMFCPTFGQGVHLLINNHLVHCSARYKGCALFQIISFICKKVENPTRLGHSGSFCACANHPFATSPVSS